MQNFFTKETAERQIFFQLPKLLFTDEKYKGISTDAKVLYAVLLDRLSLSIENNWTDELGRVYMIYTRESIQEYLGFAKQKVIKLFKELREVDLLEEKKQGKNKPNLLYLKKYFSDDSRGMKIIPREVRKSYPINTNNIKTDKKEKKEEKSVSQSVNKKENISEEISSTKSHNKKDSQPISQKENMQEVKTYFQGKLNFTEIKENHEYEKKIVDEIEFNILDMYFSNKIKINGDEKQQPIVREALRHLTSDHIEELLIKFSKVRTKIQNPKSYMQSMIYNIVFENAIDLNNQVHTDLG